MLQIMERSLFGFLVLAVFVNYYEVAAKPPLKIVNGTTADDGEFSYMVQVSTTNGYFLCGGSIIGPEWILTVFKMEELAAKPSLKIVNGTTADDGEFPYMVQVRTKMAYFTCGGSIIGPEWILTAGHCVEDGDIDSIVYGTNQLYDGDGNPNTTIKVKASFLHPNFIYVLNTPRYDVGILQLSEPIPFGQNAQAISIPDADAEIPVHRQGVLSGWGGFDQAASLPSSLQKINLQLLTDEECTQKIDDYNAAKIFNATHNICSDDHYNGGCYGDSGSPFVINETEYGILSWSLEPCYGVVPNTYSRIANPEYRNWIKNITGI